MNFENYNRTDRKTVCKYMYAQYDITEADSEIKKGGVPEWGDLPK